MSKDSKVSLPEAQPLNTKLVTAKDEATVKEVANEPVKEVVKPVTKETAKVTGNNKLKLGMFKLHESVTLPKFGTEQSACFDLYTHLKADDCVTVYTENNTKRLRLAESRGIVLHSGERALIPTGLIFDIPEGYELKLYPRSSVAVKQGLNLINCTAIIDSDYVNELFIAVFNASKETQIIENNIRLAQGQLAELVRFDFVEIESKPKQKTDRIGGIGSTGKS